MQSAFIWGFIASSSLVIGGLLGCWFTPSKRLLGTIMAFGAGVLISAVAYELVFEAVTLAKKTGFPIAGLFAGGATFFLSDLVIGRMSGSDQASTGRGSMAALIVPMVLAIILDGIPESVAIGLGILEGGTVSAAMLVAVFISNLPEAIAGTSGMKSGGWSNAKILSLWIVIAVVCAIASAAGYALLGDASNQWLAFVQAFAGGAILMMLANSMIPEAYEYARKLAGIFMILGFATAVGVVVLERSA